MSCAICGKTPVVGQLGNAGACARCFEHYTERSNLKKYIAQLQVTVDQHLVEIDADARVAGLKIENAQLKQTVTTLRERLKLLDQ